MNLPTTFPPFSVEAETIVTFRSNSSEDWSRKTFSSMGRALKSATQLEEMGFEVFSVRCNLPFGPSDFTKEEIKEKYFEDVRALCASIHDLETLKR